MSIHPGACCVLPFQELTEKASGLAPEPPARIWGSLEVGLSGTRDAFGGELPTPGDS
jgi:hypothetical protein